MALLYGVLISCGMQNEHGSSCSNDGFVIAPTATRPRDPDLFSPPEPPASGDGAVYCPTPIVENGPTPEPLTGFVATDVTNLSLDSAGQELQAVAMGDDMLAAGWVNEGDVHVALARGGNHFQVRRVNGGENVALAFSPANRLHLTHEHNGQVFYRAADQGTHPADAPEIAVGPGRKPQVAVDELNWAHVLYERDGGIYQAKHLSGEQWLTRYVTAAGASFTVRAFYNERETSVFGVPSNAYWFGLFLAVQGEQEVRILRYLSWFNLWQQVAVFPLTPGEALTGPAGLDYHITTDGESWVYAAWVTRRPYTAPPMPLYSQPFYEAANPLYPTVIANPQQIHEGLNAVRWRSEGAPFDAGLRQSVRVPDPFGDIRLEAYGLAEAIDNPDLNLRIGIDPTGGHNPNSPMVVWSDAAAPGAFTPFNVGTQAAGDTATLFLHATLNTQTTQATVVWDTVRTENAIVHNSSFEGAFVAQSTLAVPEEWTAYYRDGSAAPISGRDIYTVYAAWSRDGGANWSGAAPLVANRDASGATTGAIRPDVYPIITTATDPPAVGFFYIYESGDPPPGTAFLRFGRPALAVCELGSNDCSDSPGAPLLPRNVVRPGYRLLLAPDAFHQERAVMIWDALQTDYVSKDVYVTTVVVR